MKRFPFICIFVFLTSLATGQFTTTEKIYVSPSGIPNWIQIREDIKISPDQFFEQMQDQLNLSPGSEMVLVATENDKHSLSHLKYDQYVHGVRVMGSRYILHSQFNKVKTANGYFVSAEFPTPAATLNADQAMEKAIRFSGATQLAWDVDDHRPSLYTKPEPELVWLDKNYPEESGDFVLVYYVDIHSLEPHQRLRMFIDAQNGTLIKSYNILTDCAGEKGQASTLYLGDNEINTISKDNTYYLIDDTRGGGIETYNQRRQTYADDDNIWDKSKSSYKVGAHDVHLGAMHTWDYFKEILDRDGIDGKGSRVLCEMMDTVKENNAYWNGTATRFGTGDGTQFTPFTSIEIVGHEMSHGLTEFTAGLEYLYESGAMNEAVSDIFGKCIEKKYNAANFTWLIGEDIFLNKRDTGLRSMSDPNRMADPKAYKGKYWISSSGDNGGVHTNSGVLNFWFYLLAEGGSGVNEFGKTYTVQALGFDKAAQLVYNMLKNYLSSTSKYYDAREATLAIMSGQFGPCSDEYKNIAEAWHAVGVGRNVAEDDLVLTNDKIPLVTCKDGSYRVETRLVNSSCDHTIPTGTPFTFSFSVNGATPVIENYVLASDLLPGTSFQYDFVQWAYLDKVGINRLEVKAFHAGDTDTSNNTIVFTINKLLNNTDHDFSLTQFNVRGTPCAATEKYRVTSNANYNGCTVIPPGEALRVVYEYSDGQNDTFNFTTTKSAFPGTQLNIPAFLLKRNFVGVRVVKATLQYAKDTILNNNSNTFQIVYLNDNAVGYHESFSGGEYDSTSLVVRLDSFAKNKIVQDFSGDEAIVFTGGTVFNSTGAFIANRSSDYTTFAAANRKFSSNIYLCADLNGIQNAKLEFDHAQHNGSLNYDSLNIANGFNASTRLTMRNVAGTSLFNQNILSSEDEQQPIARSFPINHSGFVYIELANITLQGNQDPINGKIDPTGDIVLFDNIKIIGDVVNTDDKILAKMELFPNPAEDHITIYNHENEKGRVDIRNMVGKSIHEQNILPGENLIKLLEGMYPGLYIINVITENGKERVFRLIKT